MIAPEKIGHILTVDLGTGRCETDPFPATAVSYFGGRGFNVWYLYHHLIRPIDPFSPDNILLFSCGLLTGSSAPVSSRLHINALSPLTGILGSSNIGGYAGPWMRSCNISSLVIKQASKKPVYLYIDSTGARLKDASHLWGCDAFETQDRLNAVYSDKKIKVLAIGPGGENRVRFAAIMTEKDHAAGRTGMGAVMGSKNLKAIVIEKGTHRHFKAVTDQQKEAIRSYATEIRNAPEFEPFSDYGGAGYLNWVNEFGIMGSKNYSDIGVTDIEKIDGRKLKKKVIKKTGCYRCPIQCKADLNPGPDPSGSDRPESDQSGSNQSRSYQSGPNRPKVVTRPEFEPVINLGPKCGLNNLDQIIRLDNLCGRLGIDSTSASGAIAFAMALSEKNILPEPLTRGLDLTWGNAATMEKLIFQMVEGKGLGKLLSQGVRRAAEQIGHGAEAHAIHVKGLELTAYHPAAIMGTALGYAVSSRGGDYNNVYASLEYSWTKEEALKEFGTKEAVNIKSIAAKGYLIKKAVTTNIIVDALGLCKVPVLSLLRSFNLEKEAELIQGLTGARISHTDLAETGLKIAAMERLFNIRHRERDIEDRLPEIFIGDNDENKLTKQDFQTMLAEYYQAMGWDERGIPDTTGLNEEEEGKT